MVKKTSLRLGSQQETDPETTTISAPSETLETPSLRKDLEAVVKVLRKRIKRSDMERTPGRPELEAHIDDLRGRVERAEYKEDQLIAQLIDQREAKPEPAAPPKKRGFFS